MRHIIWEWLNFWSFLTGLSNLLIVLSASIKTIFLSRCLQGQGSADQNRLDQNLKTWWQSMDPCSRYRIIIRNCFRFGNDWIIPSRRRKENWTNGKSNEWSCNWRPPWTPYQSRVTTRWHCVSGTGNSPGMESGAGIFGPGSGLLPGQKFDLYKYWRNSWSLSVYVSFQCSIIWNCLLCQIKTSIWNIFSYIDYISSPGKKGIFWCYHSGLINWDSELKQQITLVTVRPLQVIQINEKPSNRFSNRLIYDIFYLTLNDPKCPLGKLSFKFPVEWAPYRLWLKWKLTISILGSLRNYYVTRTF